MALATTGEQEIASLPACPAQIVVQCLTRLLRDFKTDRPTCFLLPNCRSVEGVAVRRHIIHRYDIAAAQLAIDCEIKQCEVARALFDLELCPNRPDVTRPQRRLGGCPSLQRF
jgi:hypothetical protein